MHEVLTKQGTEQASLAPEVADFLACVFDNN